MILDPVQSSRSLVASMAAGTDFVSTAVVGNFDSWTESGSRDARSNLQGVQGADSTIADAIEFRVRCIDAPTRRLRLTGARYTLGNGVGCSIRLDDPSLRPLHAVLIRDDHRILVRAYSVPFLINNRRCTEGLLSVGDILRLGAYEFELMPLPQAACLTQETAVAIQKSLAPTASSQDDLTIRQKALDQRAEELDRQIQQIRNREAGLKTQEQAAIEVHEEFSRRHEELLSRQSMLASEQAELSAHREKLRRRQSELQSSDQLQKQEIDQLLSEQELLIRQNQETHRQLELSQEQAAIATRSIEQMRSKFTSLNEQLRELTQQQAALEQQQELRAREQQRQATVFTSQVENALASADQFRSERDQAVVERDQVTSQRDLITSQCVSIAEQRDQVVVERDGLIDAQKTWQANETELRDRIDSLQADIKAARKEADALRRDCQIARDSIRELESLVKEHQDRHESDRSSWTQEVDQMRAGVEQLSLDLAAAQSQISQLRSDNERLSSQWTDANTQRETLIRERDDWKSKFNHADQERRDAERLARDARGLVDQTNREHAQTLQQIERMEAQTRQLVDAPRAVVTSPSVPYPMVEDSIEPTVDQPTQSSFDTNEPVLRWQSSDVMTPPDSVVDTIDQSDSVPKSRMPADDVWPSYADAKSESEAPSVWGNVLRHPSSMDANVESDRTRVDSAIEISSLADESLPAWPTFEQPDADDSIWPREPERAPASVDLMKETPIDFPKPSMDDPLPVGTLAEKLIRDLELETGTQLFGHAPRSLPKDDFERLESAPDGATQMWSPEAQDSHVSAWNSQPQESMDEPEPMPSSYVPASLPIATATEESADEDSIEAYMNRLLQRVQGQSSSIAATPASSPPVPVAVNQTQSVQLKMITDPVVAPETPAVKSNFDADAPLIPRSQAPEKNTNLSAMRELANESARSAIHRSAKSQSRNTKVQAFVKFAQAGIAILCGIAAMAMVKGNFKMIAAAAALVIAAVCVREGWLLMSVSRERRTVSSDSEEPTDDNC